MNDGYYCSYSGPCPYLKDCSDCEFWTREEAFGVPQSDINLSVVCPFNQMTCPIMEDLPVEERTLLVCDKNCEVDITEVFTK